ncbi:MAG TPA: GLPGLI family protein [Cyclobacteriaceae bacterium]
MKRIIILLGILVSLAAGVDVMSQDAQGVITYEVKVDMHRRIPKEREAMKSMVPQFRAERQQLFFNANESLYKKLEEDSEEEMGSGAAGGGGGMRIVMNSPKVEIFLSNTDQLRYILQEFMGKEYLIIDTLKVSPWKFGTETKVIQGYECKQAYFTDEPRPGQKQEVTAWYTDRIRPFLGPERFQSLPGTVLAVDLNNGERVMVAQTIELRPLKKNELKKPTGGTQVTQAEFRAMVEEQIKKLGGGNGFIIRN